MTGRPTNGPIRVVIVDDSSLARAVLTEVLEAEGDIVVVGEAASGADALRVITLHEPDLVTMDVDMPGMDGITAIRHIMAARPVPILVVTAELLGPGSDLGFRAIDEGALDFMAKPSGIDEEATARLRTNVRVLAKVPVFARGPASRRAEQTAPPAAPAQASAVTAVEIIAIAGGIGAPHAISAIVRRLPATLPCIVAIAHPTEPRLVEAYARHLQTLTPLRVSTVTVPQACPPGEIVLPSGDAHLICPRRGVLASSSEAPVGGMRPSADVLFRTIADVYGPKAIAVAVAGTGRDGVAGLAYLKAAGALTLAESPRAPAGGDASRDDALAGVVDRTMPAELIADFLVATVSPASRTTTAPPSGTTTVSSSR